MHSHPGGPITLLVDSVARMCRSPKYEPSQSSSVSQSSLRAESLSGPPGPFRNGTIPTDPPAPNSASASASSVCSPTSDPPLAPELTERSAARRSAAAVARWRSTLYRTMPPALTHRPTTLSGDNSSANTTTPPATVSTFRRSRRARSYRGRASCTGECECLRTCLHDAHPPAPVRASSTNGAERHSARRATGRDGQSASVVLTAVV